MNKARIGFFGHRYEFEVYVVTDDEGQVPHIHIRDSTNLINGLNTSVELYAARYLFHNGSNDRMEISVCEALEDFMNEPCRHPQFVNNYEFAVTMWECNNSTQCSIKLDENNKIVVPNYKNIKDYE